MMRKAMPAGRQGYTLIEVLVSLTIIGLLFGFGFASFRDFSRRQQVAGVARTIKGELRLIQGKASAGEKPSGCTGNLSGYGFRVSPPASYEITAICTAPVSIKTVNLDGITMSSTQNTISFKVLGQGNNVQVTNAVITLTQTGTDNKAYITITPGGEIK